MFGIIVSGRLVQTEAQQVNENQFLFNIPEADNINHVVVFMTVYFSWPRPEGPVWLLLGHITNQKPSAIFKIANLKTGGEDTQGQVHFGLLASQQSHLAQIGISVEPLAQLAQQTPITTSSDTSIAPFVEFCGKMLENFFNYASSFALCQKNNPVQAIATEFYIVRLN
nr:hypothetical protein BaRGS_028608 [Batillaria attramentaria]